jgi:hypothetical protein
VGHLRFSSDLPVSPQTLWRHATSPAGVNAELAPLLRMTFPKGTEDLTRGWRPGERRFRSWLLLLGLIPVEYDDLCLVEVEPGRRFLERSTLLSQRLWEHERTIEPTARGACVTDRVRFEPRLRRLEPVHAAAFRLVFALRHRNLRRRFTA